MDSLRGFGNIGMGSRLKRLSEYMMKETQVVYDTMQVDFDPYLFPSFKIIAYKDGVTNTEINESLQLSQPAITQAINKLLKKGLIVTASDKIDKRKKIIKLSKKGSEQLVILEPIWKAIEKTINEVTQHESKSLIEHINHLEDTFNKHDFSKRIIANMETKTNVEIINYKKEYRRYFYDLNIEWLEAFFTVEDYDKEVLSKPEQYILDKGGYIFYAKYQGEVVGTVALMPMKESNTYELTKMAVTPKYRGLKIGQKLIQHCIDFAKEHQFGRLLLYSNRVLENAIYIYRKYGFIEIPVEENSPYKRSDIKMEYPLK